MQQHSPTQKEVDAWKRVYARYRDRLKPNRISGAALYRLLSSRYPLLLLDDTRAEQIARCNITENECFACQLPPGVEPEIYCAVIEPRGAGETLYRNREPVYREMEIVVCIDAVSGYFSVEGSSLLWDELYAARGLNESDLGNYYAVAEYVSCLNRFGLLEQTLAAVT